MTRQRPGGEMLDYWRQDPMPAFDFVIERVGREAARAIEYIQSGKVPASYADALDEAEVGRFRLSGEVHQWMYDRFSLRRLLLSVGFVEPRVCKADESAVEGFESFQLDTMPDGSMRKPDSLYMEARRR